MDNAYTLSVRIGNAADFGDGSVYQYGSGVRGVDSAEYVDEGGFAGPVFAEQSVDLPAAKIKVNIVQSGSAAEMLCETFERY